jgi:N-hydroxyarylamine O-acetyltransferase
VPFENLSIHIPEPIILDDEALFAKIVERGRGGFCYEVNGLFAGLLRALGFSVQMLAAEVADAKGEFGPEFDHLTLMVKLDERRWLVDVGFGDSFLEPLLLDSREEQTQDGRAYKIVAAEKYLILMQRENDGKWKAQYRFTLKQYKYSDFEAMCRYHQTSPESHFTQRRICSRATEKGRLTLSEMRFIKTEKAGKRMEQLLTSQKEYEAMLREHFGILLTNRRA